MDVQYHKRIGSSKVCYFRDGFRTFCYIFIITSLFQPYRLAILLIVAGALLNGAVAILTPMFAAHFALQLGAHFIVSLAVVVSAISLSVYPVAKTYLSQMQSNE